MILREYQLFKGIDMTELKRVINCAAAAAAIAIIAYIAFAAVGSKGTAGVLQRAGLIILAVALIIQFRNWWIRDRGRRDRMEMLSNIVKCATSSDDPDENINMILGLLGEEFKAERAFVFEDQNDGTYSNTYEWCAPGIEPKASDFTHVPFKGHVDKMFEDMKKSGKAVVRDSGHLDKNTREEMRETFLKYGIRNTIAAPLEINGECMGFCGLDNVTDKRRMDDAAGTISLLAYFFSQLVIQRNNNKRLQKFGYYDLMTGVGNRRAFERYKADWLDTGISYGYVMCDINGLKMVNDLQGHEAGDAMIKDVASCLAYVFGDDCVFRMGGDEFVAIFRDGDETDLRKKIDGVRVMLRHKERSASIGYVFCRDGSISFEEVKIKADKLMYMEKEDYYSGKNDRRKRKR